MIGNESKKDHFATPTAISKRSKTNLGIKISRHTISRRPNEIDLNCRVDSTKPYISKMNKMSRLKLPPNPSYGLETSEIVFISAMSQNLTCSFVSGEGSFDAVLSNVILLIALKAAYDSEEEVQWCLA